MEDVGKGEKCHEIWNHPQLNYILNPNLSSNTRLSFRVIGRKLDDTRTKDEYGIYKRIWREINEIFAGVNLIFNKKQLLWLNYIYIDKQLVNTLYNK